MALVVKLTGLVEVVSNSVDSKIENLEQRVQDQWLIFEKMMEGKIVQPDDKEVVISHAEKWRCGEMPMKSGRTRMGNEDKITTNSIEALRSEVNRMSAKMAEDLYEEQTPGECSQDGIRVHGKWPKCGELCRRVALQHRTLFVGSRTELQGWGCWRNIRWTAG